MTTQVQSWRPSSSFKALLDQLYDIKFSKHTTLTVVMLSMIYTIYRTQHWLAAEFGLAWLVAWPTAIFIEALVLAAAAFMFSALRHAYVAELKQEDAERAKVGIGIAYIALGAAFLALGFVAWSDAYRLTHEVVPTLIMSLAQFVQMLFIVGFISAADLDEREKLRMQLAGYKVNTAKQQAGQCPYCFRAVASNNRARHIAVCPMRPQIEETT